MKDINELKNIYQYDVNRMRQMTSNLYDGGQAALIIDYLRRTVQDTINSVGGFFFGPAWSRVMSILSRGMAALDIIPQDSRMASAIDRSFQEDFRHAQADIPTRRYSNEYYERVPKDKMLALSDFVIKRTSVLDYLIRIERHSSDMYYANEAVRPQGDPDLGLDEKMEASLGSLDRKQIHLDMCMVAQRAPQLLSEGMDRAADRKGRHFTLKDDILMALSQQSQDRDDVKDQMGHLKRQDRLIYDNKDGDMAARPIDNAQWHDLIDGILKAAFSAI